MTNFASDDDVEPAGPGPYVEMGDPDLAALVGDAAGTLQDLHWELHRVELDEVAPDWDGRLDAIEELVAHLRDGLATRVAMGLRRPH
jgi:hypothetical protein